ncbi:FliI/YscN family ATPase [Octadecabacter sp. 1_MG-2023]|uniref:FliI/YscN family ATPase n=1 Tax=unclassified Octadecabacter TaxID=196158 RepID=UPI001C0A2015|nr:MULTISPECIES: FliI/YscN family ATPase [unclassified Octadecabacter]MBU2992391.1 FliI/YscN family ATPase [Octadecabacter sp. B2R22]MDO6734852.1 FliI/YscN family ATPase [Octadecabacter sp. 1_MG-2023]
MTEEIFAQMGASLNRVSLSRPVGEISEIAGGAVQIRGLSAYGAVGDRIRVIGHELTGEIVRVGGMRLDVMMDGSTEGLGANAKVVLLPRPALAPHAGWIGRVVDPDGQPLDGRPLLPGVEPRRIDIAPLPAASRRGLGARLATGFAVFDTILPIVRGQRIGLFAGSGVGKSTLLATLAKKVDADVIIIGLVGERGRELREFVEKSLGPDGMARSVIVAATSDRAPQVRRRCPQVATTVAEFFRDQGLQVLLLIDSVTRFAEAHREVAVAAGETANLRGHPASTPAAIAGLCERAGPGKDETGDITAIYSVLVAGSDMEEPVADMLRGVLDGHVVLDRTIAERGRFPAIDVTRSVSRSLPDAANAAENKLIASARRHMGAYAQAELMIQSGLYANGSDQKIDDAIATHDALENFIAMQSDHGIVGAFRMLQRALQIGGA